LPRQGPNLSVTARTMLTVLTQMSAFVAGVPYLHGPSAARPRGIVVPRPDRGASRITACSPVPAKSCEKMSAKLDSATTLATITDSPPFWGEVGSK
jgi:hypothetical protein